MRKRISPLCFYVDSKIDVHGYYKWLDAFLPENEKSNEEILAGDKRLYE